MSLKLHNTLTRRKEDFVPLKEGIVHMYSCGPTVYDFAHIGNFRAYVTSDILKRYLIYSGYKVKHVMNITDVDDKTIRGSNEQGIPLNEYTKKYTNAFMEDMETLNMIMPDIFCKATEHVEDMINVIKILMEKGYGYKTSDGIYYNISEFEDYGKLSKIDLTSIQAGASQRVLADEYDKENINDFALWKFWTEEDGDVFWETDIGKGRPGWHIECSTMSTKYLGNTFDIHTGGVDLIFPHHENEIAQSEAATNDEFVKYWFHNEWILVEGKKMSKSEGNYYTLRDLIDKGYDGRIIRYALMNTHYKHPLNFTFEGLEGAKNSVQRILDFVGKLQETEGEVENPKVDNIIEKSEKNFKEAMDDDLNISEGLAAIFDMIKNVNKIEIGKKNAEKILERMEKFDIVLGILPKESEKIDEEIEALIKQREDARENKDFAKADEIRNELDKQGIILEDTPQGTRWKRKL